MSFFMGGRNYKLYFTRSVILRIHAKKPHHTLNTINAHWLPEKKASPFPPFNIKLIRKRGSITVEASIAFPLFLFAVINLLSILDIMRFQSDMEAAVHQVGREMAVYGYLYYEIDGADSGLGNIIASKCFTEIYARDRIKNELGSGYVENSSVISKDSGLNLSKTRIMQDDIIDLIVEYKVKPIAALTGFQSFTVRNRCRMHAWTGYDIQSVSNVVDDIWVYITESGEVYHLSRNCSYISLSVQSVFSETVNNLRNHSGAKYYACEICGEGSINNTVYITDYGNKYHGTISCSGLKRTVFTIPFSKVGSRSLCKKCST